MSNKGFVLAVVGGRDFHDRDRVWKALDLLHISRPIAEIVSGGASGADQLGVSWAKARGVKFTEFIAAWDDIEAPGAVIRTNKNGKPYNVLAGFVRNKSVVDYAGAVVAYWDGKSPGTKDTIDYCGTQGKPIKIFTY